jgi:glycosyltransferase involved in cell wall biosynthesis
MKILFYATYPTQNIGYSKIANILTNYLAMQINIELYYFGIHNYAETKVDRFVHPNITFIDVNAEEIKKGVKQDFGMEIIEEVITSIKPDVFFIYNDLIVVSRLFNTLIPYKQKFEGMTKFIVYIDLVYPFERVEYLQHLNNHTDLIFVFSKYWKDNLIDCGFVPEKIKIMNHGINKGMLSLKNVSECRKELGIQENDFVILNTNRNCYRKANDLTISSFIRFLKSEGMRPDIKLFLNCYLNTGNGYDILSIIRTECVRHKVDYNIVSSNHIIIPASKVGYVSDEIINSIYNACDVGINTCIGEGFGMCNFEHAYLGHPQIIPRVGGLGDIFSKEFSYIIEPVATITASNLLDGHNGILYFSKEEDYVEGMKYYYHNRNKIVEHGVLARNHISDNYDWDNILKQFHYELKNFLGFIV